MRTSRTYRPLAVAAITLAGFGLVAGCGNADSVGADKVAKLAHDELEKQIDSPFEVTCPNDIKTKEGESMECTITFEDGVEQPLTATIESIDGSTAHFNFEAGTASDGTGGGGTDTGS
jgi:hypothetical protein